MLTDIYFIGQLITFLYLLPSCSESFLDAVLGAFVILTWPIWAIGLFFSKMRKMIWEH